MMSQTTDVPTGSPRSVVAQRLREAGINADPFINVDGPIKKATDHDTRYATPPAGKYAVYTVEGLVILDVDPHEGDLDLPADLPSTFTVGSPHDGEHRYYVAPSLDSGTESDGGSLRVVNQYGLGPGSILGECRKDWHDCSQSGEGHYRIKRDLPVARLDAETADSLYAAVSPSGTSEQQRDSVAGASEPGVADDAGNSNGRQGVSIGPDNEGAQTFATTTSATLSTDHYRRIQRMFESERGEKIRALWEGRYGDAGFGDDRSRAEQALVSYLGWWFGDDKATVAALMNLSCKQHSHADTGERRKWLDRDDSYRTKTLDTGCDHESTYQPPQEQAAYENRPDVSDPTRERVLDALRDCGPATTAELVDHGRVDKSKRQVRRALRELRDDGIVVRTPSFADARKDVYGLDWNFDDT